MANFSAPLEHLRSELARLDLLLHREILRLRAAYQLSLDEFRGLYISDQQVDQLVNLTATAERPHPLIGELSEHARALGAENRTRLGGDLPWSQMIHAFALTPVEQDVLLLALAPEIDDKYETLYAYLNNDVTRKYPTGNLALRLFGDDEQARIQLRALLGAASPLITSGILSPIPSRTDCPYPLASGFTLSPILSRFVLGLPAREENAQQPVSLHTRLVAWSEVPLSSDRCAEMQRLGRLFIDSSDPPVVVLEGRTGAGRWLMARAVCGDLSRPVLRIDCEMLRGAADWDPILRDLLLEQRLRGAVLYVNAGPSLFDHEGISLQAQSLVHALGRDSAPLFFACAPGAPWRDLWSDRRLVSLHLNAPDYEQRRTLWQTGIAARGAIIDKRDLDALANRFVLMPGQIGQAITRAIDRHRIGDHPEAALQFQELLESAQAQSTGPISRLAVRVELRFDWDDLVLAPAILQRIKELAAAIKFRHLVYSRWGFEQRVGTGRGLKVLFTGSSGTGKTMTAGVIARDLGLELYKIDLSAIVSKYIGETEKNLDRIFDAADASNAILFFDEADALFGKRSEVKDAHDRYANIEVAYLLQRMDEYDGAVILASNLRKNIDDAFSRRIHYVVEFPMPDQAQRERLWRGMFPPRVPLGSDVDLAFLAQQFALAGGDIQNVALEAAFLAAQDGQVITMRQLIVAMARQLTKQGKMPSPTEFKQYHPLIGQG